MHFYTINEVAAILKVNHKTIRAEIDKGKLKSCKVAGVYRISQQQFDNYLTSIETEKPPAKQREVKPGRKSKIIGEDHFPGL